MNDFVVSLMLLGSLSPQGGGDLLPLWATANRFGIMPDSGGGTALLQASSSFDEGKTLQFRWGASLGLRSDSFGTDFIPDELYAGLRWKTLRLDLGLWHPQQSFGGAEPLLGTLSSTGGNIMMSGNARSMPGYSLNVEPCDVPFTGGHVQFFGSFGDYRTTDTRYVSGAMVHNTSLFLRAHAGAHLALTAGIDHYTLWGGDSPDFGPQRLTPGNYLRILAGLSGGGDSSIGDQINALGDHRGRELIAAAWAGNGWTLTLQHDIPYDDFSGMIFRNFPDGVNTVALSFEDKSLWVSDIVYEYHNTMNQSGDCERRPATAEEIASGDPRVLDGYLIAGGADNYCNNYEYRSGWTSYGRPVGSPFFYPRGTLDGSWSRYSVTFGTWNNLLSAHHFALSGSLFRKIPYKLMLSFTRNFGCWFNENHEYDAGSRLDAPLNMFSSGFECSFPLLRGSLQLVPGIYADAGDVLPMRGWAATVRIKYNLIKK